MNSAHITPARSGDLLERSRELAAFDGWLDEIRTSSSGRCVLMAGEAGVGKTALLRRACANAGEGTPVLWGACDSLFTPQPLGPLLDIADATGGELAELVAAGAKPHAIASALSRELAERGPSLLVFEDLHWADEASLDVLRILARRIGTVPTLLLATYRQDGLERDHPLRLVVGELATAERLSRLVVAPLSPGAVAELAAPHGVDADHLYRTTGGNAFFVTEVLAAAGEDIPATVRDAVLARAARLTTGGRRLLDAAAVIPPPVDLTLLAALDPNVEDHLDECLHAGMLTMAVGSVAFRHELARLAVDQALAPGTKRNFHARALASLGQAGADAARLAHHAEGSGDVEMVLRYAPEAALDAAQAGAHREAAAQYERALRFSDGAPPTVRGALLDARAHECTLVGEFSEGIAVGRQALSCWRTIGDRGKEGRALAMLAWPLWTLGSTRDAERAAREAVQILEELSPGPDLINAYSRLSTILWGSGDIDAAVDFGERALELAERLGDRAAAVNALVTIAVANLWRPLAGARAELEETLELARSENVQIAAGYAYVHLAGYALHEGRFALAESYTSAGLAYCGGFDLDSFAPHLVAMRAEVELAGGRWDEAASSASEVLARHGAGPATQSARLTLGRLRARLGDPGVWEPLDLALAMAESSGELWRLGLVAAARAEAAWLEGRLDAVVAETDRAFALSRRLMEPCTLGQLGVWRRRAGSHDDVTGAAEPYATQLAGNWEAAAARWRQLGGRYEAALALADADEDHDALREALDELQAMGSAPAAAIVARRLRSRGARGLPRGPRPRTRQNPANLTQREVEVLGLVAEGLRNADIATRLFLSPKTVAHHVSAILHKLDVETRGEAGATAARLGLVPRDE